MLRWLFVYAPARAYKRGEETGGSVPWLYLFVLIVSVAAGGLIGAAAGYLIGDADTGVGVGVVIAPLLVAGWFIYVLLLVGVMRLRGQPLESLLPPGWQRRRGHWYEH